MATEQETVEFLAKCETGLIPDKPPKKKERAPIEHKENFHLTFLHDCFTGSHKNKKIS